MLCSHTRVLSVGSIEGSDLLRLSRSRFDVTSVQHVSVLSMGVSREKDEAKRGLGDSISLEEHVFPSLIYCMAES